MPSGYPSVWTQYSVTLSGISGTPTGRLAFRYFVENGGPAGANSDYIGIDTVAYDCNGNSSNADTDADADTDTDTDANTDTNSNTQHQHRRRHATPTPGGGGSALDGFDPNANGEILVVVVQPDGKILIGGTFTTLSPNGGGPVTRNHIARLNPDGTLDTAFNPNANGDCRFNRGAGGRQDFGGRQFHQHRRTNAQLHRPARCHDWLGRFVQPEREQCVGPINRGAGGRQDFGGRRFH